MPMQRIETNPSLNAVDDEINNKKPIRSCLSSGSFRGTIRRQVSFHKIEIREYERSIGDNVASCGVPLSLGWQYDSAGELDLESYEKHRPKPRSREEMKLPNHVRMDLLKEAGYSLADRMAATKKSNIERNRRKATAAKTEELTRAEYVLERAGRSLKKAFNPKLSKTKSKEKEEIASLIRRDRLRTSNNNNRRAQFQRVNSCPTLDLSTHDLSSDETTTPRTETKPEQDDKQPPTPETTVPCELERFGHPANPTPLTAAGTVVDTNKHQDDDGDDDDWFVGEDGC